MARPNYPTPVSTSSGCKVGWYVYETREDAEAASAAARVDASRMRNHGYDFGYCTPGSITERPDGMFVVTVP